MIVLKILKHFSKPIKEKNKILLLFYYKEITKFANNKKN